MKDDRNEQIYNVSGFSCFFAVPAYMGVLIIHEWIGADMISCPGQNQYAYEIPTNCVRKNPETLIDLVSLLCSPAISMETAVLL